MTIGDVMGMFGTMTAMAEIYLYEAKIPMEGGEPVNATSIEAGNITCKDIRFTYPTKKDITVIKDVTIEVAKNRTIALVGSSGCGKSTIIQLVERFYDPLVGSVSYGNQDLK